MRSRKWLLTLAGVAVLGAVGGWWAFRSPPAAPVAARDSEASPTLRPTEEAPTREGRRVPEAPVAAVPPAEDVRAESRPEPSAPVPPPVVPSMESGSEPARGRAVLPIVAGGAGAAPVEGSTMDKEDIRAAVNEVKPGLRRCYQALAKRDPSPHRVVVRFTVVGQATGGFFKDADIVESTLNDPLFLSCFLQELSQARFRAPRGTGEESITYPFTFAGVADAGG